MKLTKAVKCGNCDHYTVWRWCTVLMMRRKKKDWCEQYKEKKI